MSSTRVHFALPVADCFYWVRVDFIFRHRKFLFLAPLDVYQKTDNGKGLLALMVVIHWLEIDKCRYSSFKQLIRLNHQKCMYCISQFLFSLRFRKMSVQHQ